MIYKNTFQKTFVLIFVLLAVCLSATITQAQWSKIGADIDGEAGSDYSGWSVSMSDDGSIVAVGAPYNSGTASAAGHVRIYEWDGSAWTQKGIDIDGEAEDDKSGCAVSMSADGTTVAIGALNNDGTASDAGHVRIYEWSGSAWTQKGLDIDGEAASDQSGYSVSLNSDGSSVAIGAYDNDDGGTNAGHVRIYEWSGSAWAQKGIDIDGEAGGDQSGFSVSMSANGNIVAIGALYNDGIASDAGHVRVYKWSGSTWAQLGNDIDGEAAGDKSGCSVSMSADGNTVVIGAYYNDGTGTNAGHARVYEWSGSTWDQLGNDIDGEAGSDFSGWTVSISSDATTVAIGASENDGAGSTVGHTRVYKWNGSEWTQTGADIDGEAAFDNSGYSVALSSDGSKVVIGALYNDGAGSSAGHARVYYNGEFSDLGAWYYGTTFKATEDAYLDGFTIYTNATNPSNAYMRVYGPFSDESEASNLILGGGSAALGAATPLIKLQGFGTSDFTYTTSPPPFGYTGSLYGLNYVQTDPDIEIVVDGLVKGVEVEADKYYLIFFAVSNATYSGNQYRVTRVVGTEPTGSGYELEKTYYLHYSSPHQRSIAPYLDIELTFSADNQWTGDTDTDWADADNWSRDIVPSDFASVTIAASDNAPTISTTISIGDLEVQSGASLDVTGEVSVTGALTNSGEIAGDVVLNGSRVQSVNLGTIEEVEVDNSSGVTLTGDASISKVITLTNGEVETGGYALELLSDEDYTGLIVDNGGTITGDVTVNRHVPAGFGQHFISLPTSDGDVNQLEDNFNTYLSAPNPRLHEYSEVSSTWIVPSSLADLMPTGQGFAATFGTVGSAITIDVTGTANTGNIPVSLTHSSTGWNLIGNPYPSPINWDSVSKPDDMSEAFYVWDYSGGGDGHYMSYIDGIGTNNGTNLIPCMQGFFVYTGDNTTLTFENDDRETDPDNTLVPFKSKSNNPLIRLLLEGEGYQSETVVRFKEAATANYDAKYDAILLESGIPASIDFGTISSDSRKLVINTLAYENQNEQIPIYSRIGTKGDYTIDMTETSGALEPPVVLKDLVLDSIHVLNDVSYAFSATANNSNNRFVLILQTTVEIKENETTGSNVTAFKNGNQVYINFGSELKENSTIDVYSISGQRIHQSMISKGYTYYNLNIESARTNTVLIIKIGGIDEVIKIY